MCFKVVYYTTFVFKWRKFAKNPQLHDTLSTRAILLNTSRLLFHIGS